MHSRSVLQLAVCLLLGAALSIGCSTNAPSYHEQAETPGMIFVVNGTMKPQTRYHGATDFGVVLTQYLAGSLQERGAEARAVPRGEAPPTSGRFVATEDLLEVNPGSWNVRFWTIFGPGGALIRAHVSLRDLKAKSLLYEKTYMVRSSSRQFEEGILRRILAKISWIAARDLARQLQEARVSAGQYKTP